MDTLVDTLFAALGAHAGRVAVTDPDTTLTYAELGAAAGRLAADLAAHQRPDRLRVGLLAPNSVAYVTCYAAVLRAGAVPFLIDAALGPAELAVVIEDCSLDLLIHDGRDVGTPLGAFGGLFLARLAPAADRHPLGADTAVCRFTSGSTGRPNCIEFPGHAVVAAARNWATGTGLTGGDRIACFAALSNGLAFNTSLLAAFLVGASLHLSRGLPTGGHIARLLQATGATRLVGFPALYESVVRRGLADDALAGVRIAISSGAPLRAETRAAFAALTGRTIRDYYGVAETGPLTFAAEPGAGLGRPLPGVDLRTGDDGGIRVRSASMGSRYLNAPGLLESRTDADGYYDTGDQGHLVDGELVLTGRTARMINVGGRKVDPTEVAAVLRTAPGVLDTVVFEAPDRHGGPAVVAAVTGGDLDRGALRAHCARVLAPYKVPSIVLLLADIPANSIGKPSLPALRELVTRSV
ncbi:class I adenylate-forming enzyme family protein [Longispora sp. K20-0274]|uniref:class I adenylate-forming enzyme family protein n=1 Tax=Longispora sp. K20-0274 TaxID=3088255 RepID=UPI00399AB084